MESKFNKFAMIQEMKEKLNMLADAQGTLRCGLVWNLNQLLDAMVNGLRAEDEAQAQKVNELMRVISEQQKEGKEAKHDEVAK